MYSFPDLEPVCCSMYSSNCCFPTCIQVSQEADQVVWYSHLFQNFPQFVVIHTIKGFGIVNKAEIDVFLELSCFFWWSSGCWQFDLCFLCLFFFSSSAFSKTSLNMRKFMAHVLLKLSLENFEHYFASVWDECNCVQLCSSLSILWHCLSLGLEWKLTFSILWPNIWHILENVHCAFEKNMYTAAFG